MDNGIFLLLGSNQGDSRRNLSLAAGKIRESAGKIIRASSIYKTQPWGVTDQPDFYNQVLQIASAYSPEVLLQKLLAIETVMGRVRIEKWGPRIIDIDLLFYGSQVMHSATLELPHPGVPERRFTLLPLAEIAGEFVHPVIKKTIDALLKECRDGLDVQQV
jgi:2-amino-4-hydroxy-6-hydroxymethyldihydropteridine diphosphokinase